MWLWLWCRLAAVAPIRPLAWEPLYVAAAALKKKKKKEENPFVLEEFKILRCLPALAFLRISVQSLDH